MGAKPLSSSDPFNPSCRVRQTEDATDLEQLAQRRRRTLGGDAVPLGLADLFFDSDEPLHPDQEEDDDE